MLQYISNKLSFNYGSSNQSSTLTLTEQQQYSQLDNSYKKFLSINLLYLPSTIKCTEMHDTYEFSPAKSIFDFQSFFCFTFNTVRVLHVEIALENNEKARLSSITFIERNDPKKLRVTKPNF